MAELLLLVQRYNHSKIAGPDEWYPHELLGRVRANDRTYHCCNLANALLRNADLLVNVLDYAVDIHGDYELEDLPTMPSVRALWRVIDDALAGSAPS
jgi:hypothetical protein